MSLERVKAHLAQYHLEDRIMEFPVSSASVAEAASAIGCTQKEIAKTLSFMLGEKPILIVVAGDCKVNNAKFKAEFHTKAKMIPFESVEVLIGHAVGGVCPFGVNENVSVYLDSSLQNLKTLYPACGSANSAVCLSLAELELASCYEKWIDVC
ncbi:YbaK/EbsC family protein [Helicobacter sp. MIT 21-1697]|uniref:YbaK/EbsC family protein n=1 Tax=Helicobacter sp. MIT 21-1697 TaxID=2993733 RepID=UPI00224B27D6|nr:YbaK/EbsC family protein [Helicobacter sp. MIT 21-1697]MCX2717459.1 YbaK/EbsC family protein [Helicobacter sp. MIT 21-1697]